MRSAFVFIVSSKLFEVRYFFLDFNLTTVFSNVVHVPSVFLYHFRRNQWSKKNVRMKNVPLIILQLSKKDKLCSQTKISVK